MRIRGSYAVVTGASRGLGRALAIELARQGAARVALIARDAGALGDTAEVVRAAGAEAMVVPCDLNRPPDIALAAGAVLEAFGGRVDLLVNAAGVGVWRRFLDTGEEEHAEMMAVNYWGAFWWIRGLLPSMLSRRRGRIINVSSGSARIALATSAGYSASKAALTALSESLHREFRSQGVGTLVVHPGNIDTAFWQSGRIALGEVPPLIRLAPKLRAAGAARSILRAARFGMASRTFPLPVAVLARLNQLWVRAGDFLLWRWGLPLLLALLLGRAVWRFLT